MANVPGVLIIGDEQTQGSYAVQANVSALGVTDLVKFYDADVLRVTPSVAATGAPNAAALGWYPWYDLGAQSTFYSVASSTSTTLTVSPSPAWTVNQWAGKIVTVVNSTTVGFQQRRTIVSNTADTITVASWSAGTPTAGMFFFLGQGRWKDYHPCGGYLHPTEIGSVFATRGGSSVASFGLGVGPDAGLIRQFLDNTWTTAPFFQLAKFANTAKTVGQWGTAASGIRTAFETFVAEMASAWTALANGNTLVWECVILDQSQTDVIDWATNPANYLLYQAALTAWIPYLRTALGNPSLKVLIVNHDNVINNVITPSGTLLANRIHRTVAAADANMRTVSMQGLRTMDVTFFGIGTENRPGYAPAQQWAQVAQRMREGYELLAAGNPPAYEGAIPTYLFIGDSICVGTFTETYTDALDSPTLTSGPRSAHQIIFNAIEASGEPYDVGENSNTSGTLLPSAGPECSMMVDLEVLHPTDFLLVKRGSSSSSLAADFSAYTDGGITGISGGRWSKSYQSTEHYGDLLDLFAAAKQYAHVTLGKQLDLKGIFVVLGTNDGAEAGGGALFAAELATFIADLRADFSTRTSGTPLPITWRLPQLDVDHAIEDEMLEVRAALEAYALTDEQFQLINVDDLERMASDNIHENGDSAIVHGQRQVAAMVEIAI